MIKQNLVTNNTYTLKDPDHDEIKDGYQLRWVGKNYAKLQANLLPETVIVPDSTHNSQESNKDSQNLFLTGDNLEVLKHLEHAYTDKVDVIYIDPPYNTGSDGFVYNDDFRFTDDQLRDTLGLTDEEVKRIKNIYGKSSHSAWLTFIYPRIKIAKKLLKDTGVIFVSVDDNEQANLKLLMDEVMTEGTFYGQLTWINRTKPKNMGNSKYSLQQNTEYVLVYGKTTSDLHNFTLPTTSQKQYPEKDEKGNFRFEKIEQRKNIGSMRRDGMLFEIFGLTPKNGYRWQLSEKERNRLIELNKLVKKDANIFKKVYPADEDEFANEPFWSHRIDTGTTEQANEEIEQLMEHDAIFETVKPLNLIKQIMMFNPSDSLVLDFFAGSGTTAHAVMDLNKDSGNRRFIMCTLDEKVKEGSEAEKAGYKTIDEIARERIKRAAKQIGDTTGFRHYRFVKPSITTLDKIENLVPSPIAPEDMIVPFGEKELTGKGSSSGIHTILTTWLVDDGYDFTTSPKPLDFAGYTAYYAEGIARIYLIEKDGWTSESCKALLNKLGKNEIAVNMIVVYPYSLNFVDLTELKNNIKANLDGKPEVYERY